MSGEASAAGQEIPLQGEGVFDLKGKRGRFTMTTSVPGQQGVKIEEIVDGLVLYMHSDALAKGLPSGKKWLKLDLKAAGRQAGRRRRPAAVAQRRRRPDAVPELPGQGRRRPQGRHRGRQRHPTTHYHATIDFDKLAGSAGKAADSVRQLEQITGLKQLPTDIWIDASRRVRRQTVAIEHKQPLPIKFSLQIDYKRFGVPVDVQAPARRRDRRLQRPSPRPAAERPRAGGVARGGGERC